MIKVTGLLVSVLTMSLVLAGIIGVLAYDPAPVVVKAQKLEAPSATFIPPPPGAASEIVGLPIVLKQEEPIQAVAVTPFPTVIAPEPKPGQTIKAKISWYNPALGGPNCFSFVNGACVSRMASGRNWARYIDKAVACPPEFPFGTEFDILGKTYTCWDRGGKIQRLGPNLIWLDILTKKAIVPYGTKVTVTYRLPSK